LAGDRVVGRSWALVAVGTRLCACRLTGGPGCVVFACTCGESRRTNRDGSVVRYLQLAHNERHPTAGQPVAKVIHSFGRAELVDRAALARLVNVDLAGPHCGRGRRVGRGTGREAGRCRAALTSAAGGPVPTRGPASECDRWPGPALLCNRRPGIPAHGGHGARSLGRRVCQWPSVDLARRGTCDLGP